MHTFPASHSLSLIFATFLSAAIGAPLHSEPVRVRQPQGSMHGFLVVKTTEGATIAVGDVVQAIRGGHVTSRVTFHFRDGSLDDDITIFSQRGVFRLISDHHVQRGPSFPRPIDVLIEAATGQITSRSESGKVTQEHLDLPPDVSNGLPPNLLLNILPSSRVTTISFVAPSTKPRLIHVAIRPVGEVPFAIAGEQRKATDFSLHIELGGLIGVIAPLVGKQPADFHIWILEGPSPAFIREEGQFYEGGPLWQIEQTSPRFR
jgi:hypothetical protein